MPTINLLTVALRQGTVESASESIPTGIYSMEVAAVVPSSEKNDPENYLILRAYVSSDNWVTREFVGGTSWQGGKVCHDKQDQPVECPEPVFYLNEIGTRYVGKLIRLAIESPKAMRFGARVTY